MRNFVFLFFLYSGILHGQETIYLGAGQGEIFVTASSELAIDQWNEKATAGKTINAAGLIDPQFQASRFLAQATFGADQRLIDQVVDLGMEVWIDQQLKIPPSSMLDALYRTNNEVIDWFLANGGDPAEVEGRPHGKIFNYAWWETNLSNEDLLRQRVAFALSEFFVISIQSDLEGYPDGLSSYYDILSKHAFGNYRDLLFDVSLHPCIGFYLSHLNNPKTNLEENTRPDENYAREIMQLFSIGLYELNDDGSRKKDANGNDIPTYGQSEIKEMAKVWTGLGISRILPDMAEDTTTYFGQGLYASDLTKPMKMYEEYHEPGEKIIVGGQVVPAGQSGMEDINDAIDILFNHPNVGPFLSRHLIQRLVKSNPSPGYIKRISSVFNDNSIGERGDLGAVIKAILMDPEARNCSWTGMPESGRLREPFLRYTHFSRAMDLEQYYDRFWNIAWNYYQNTEQTVFGSKSVFNFFLPDFSPNGAIADRGLVAPEYQIHNSRTSLGYINEVNRWAVWNAVMYSWEEDNPAVILNTENLKKYARDTEVLVNKLDMLLTHGQLTDRTRTIIKNALENMIFGEFREDRVRLAIYLFMISPDYNVLR